MRTLISLIVAILLCADPGFAGQVWREGQAKRQKEAYDVAKEQARAKKIEENESARGDLDRIYKSDANRSEMASERFNETVNRDEEAAAREAGLTGIGSE